MCQSLRLDFSIIKNFESMQTINNKRKYKIQQLFKMLPLVWTHAWIRFLHWYGICPVSWKSAPNLNHSRLQFWSRIGFLYTHTYMVLLLPWKPHSWHSTHIKLLKRSQSAIKYRCIL